MLCINFDFSPNKNIVKHDASGTKGILSCCKCLFEYMCIVANWAHIQAEKKLMSLMSNVFFGNGFVTVCLA